MEYSGWDYVRLKLHKSEQSKQMNIPVAEVVELFRCGLCHEVPIKPPIHTCQQGHLTCKTCRATRKDCHTCREPLLGRNQLLEKVVRSLSIQTCSALSDCSTPPHQSKSEQSLQLILDDPQHLEKLEKARLQASKVLQQPSNASLLLPSPRIYRASHRPVLCPFPCGCSVTCSGIFPHFEYYHPKVKVQTACKERRYSFYLKYEDVVFTESRCHVFFLVQLSDNLDGASCGGCSVQELMELTKSPVKMLRNGMFISTLSVGCMDDPMQQIRDNGDLEEQQALTVWCSCLYHNSPVTYTLEVTSPFIKGNTICFTGRLSSLHNSQLPADVYSRGECLVLNVAKPGKMRFTYTNNLKISVTFHTFTYDDQDLYDC